MAAATSAAVIIVVAGICTSMLAVSAVEPSESFVTVRTKVTRVSLFGGMIVPSRAMTAWLVDDFIEIEKDEGTAGITSDVTSAAGARMLVIPSAICDAVVNADAGTTTLIPNVSAKVPSEVFVILNTKFTVVSVIGGIIDPSRAMTDWLLE